jgi:hypothetical protein
MWRTTTTSTQHCGAPLQLLEWHVSHCYKDDFTCDTPLQRYFAAGATFPNHATSKVIKTLKTVLNLKCQGPLKFKKNKRPDSKS